jgi:hypothetical protein
MKVGAVHENWCSARQVELSSFGANNSSYAPSPLSNGRSKEVFHLSIEPNLSHFTAPHQQQTECPLLYYLNSPTQTLKGVMAHWARNIIRLHWELCIV